MIRSISSMSETMPARSCLVVHANLDAEAQSRQRRAQVVRYTRQQQRAVLFGLAQVGEHAVEAAIQTDDLRRPAFRQRRRRLALADTGDRVAELAQRTREIAREGVGAEQQHDERDQAPFQGARGCVLARPRQGKYRPVRPVSRLQLDPEQLQPRLDAQLRLGSQFGFQPLLQFLEARPLGRPAEQRRFFLRHDARLVGLAELGQRRARAARIGGGRAPRAAI